MENEKDILMALDHLEHAGVKGMKWGQRRAQNKLARQAKNQAIDAARKQQGRNEIALYKSAAKTVFNPTGSRSRQAGETVERAIDLIKGDNAKMARQYKSGEKKVLAVLGTVGVLSYAAAVAAAKS